MLDEQFFGNSDYSDYLTSNFVPIHAVEGEGYGDALYKQYGIRATPTVIIAKDDGTDIDRLIGYGPPADDFKARIEKAVSGINTLAGLKAAYEKNPNDLKAMVQLGVKYDDIYIRDEAKELLTKVLERAEEAKNVQIPYRDNDYTVSAYENAILLQGDLEKFIEEYPDSKLNIEAFRILSSDYSRYNPDLDKAEDFYTRMFKKYPDDIHMKRNFIRFASTNNAMVDKAIEIASADYKEKKDNNKIMSGNIIRRYAKLLAANGDMDSVDKIFGKTYADDAIMMSAMSLYYYCSFWTERKENLEDALSKADILLKLDPSFLPDVAKFYANAGNFDKTMKIFGPAFVIENKDDANQLYSYAYFWGDQGMNLNSALIAIHFAIELEPKQPYMYNAQSLILKKMGNYDMALEAAEKAFEISDNSDYYKARYEELKQEVENKKGKKQ